VVLDPPGEFEWISFVFLYVITASYGCGLGFIMMATTVFNSGSQLIVREADWLRAMDNWGDSVFLLSFVLSLLSTLPICLAFAAVWAPEMDAKNADASRR
jgi:hypothetical protein